MKKLTGIWKKPAAIAATCALALGLAACGGAPASEGSQAGSAAAAPSGSMTLEDGTITFATSRITRRSRTSSTVSTSASTWTSAAPSPRNSA